MRNLSLIHASGSRFVQRILRSKTLDLKFLTRVRHEGAVHMWVTFSWTGGLDYGFKKKDLLSSGLSNMIKWQHQYIRKQ